MVDSTENRMLLLDWSGFRSLFGVIGVFLYHAPSSRWVVWSGGSKENWAIASRSSGPGSISIQGNDMSVSSLHPNSTLVVSSVGWDEKWSPVCCIIFIKVKLRGMSMFLTATRAKSHPVNSTIARAKLHSVNPILAIMLESSKRASHVVLKKF